jgi:hypothetical protein
MWGEVQNLLMNISSLTWVIYLVAAFIAFLALNNVSYRIAVGVWLLSDLVKVAVTPAMYSLSEVSKEMTRLIWYPSFMLMSLVSIYFLYFLHKKFNAEPEPESKELFLCVFMLLCFNCMRFFDRVIFNFDLTGDIYKFGIPALKIWAAVAIFRHIWSIWKREQGVFKIG